MENKCKDDVPFSFSTCTKTSVSQASCPPGDRSFFSCHHISLPSVSRPPIFSNTMLRRRRSPPAPLHKDQGTVDPMGQEDRSYWACCASLVGDVVGYLVPLGKTWTADNKMWACDGKRKRAERMARTTIQSLWTRVRRETRTRERAQAFVRQNVFLTPHFLSKSVNRWFSDDEQGRHPTRFIFRYLAAPVVYFSVRTK